MLSLIDVLVDGPFVEAKKDISLIFRGSSNQRIIDIKKTFENKQVELYLDVRKINIKLQSMPAFWHILFRR